MLQQTYTLSPLPPLDHQFTAATTRWDAALSGARSDRDAQLYGFVITLLEEQFKPVTTIRALLALWAAPAPTLLQRVKGLCQLSGARLDPQLALGAACALRLRQLVDGVIE